MVKNLFSRSYWNQRVFTYSKISIEKDLPEQTPLPVFLKPYPLAHVNSSPRPSSFLPSMPFPSLSSPPLPKAFRLSWLSHFQAWLAVPRSPPWLPSFLPSFVPQHAVILTHALTMGLSLLFTVYNILGPGPRQGPVCATAHGSTSGSQALVYEALVSSPSSASPSPYRPYSSHMLKTACENCDFFKRLQFG